MADGTATGTTHPARYRLDEQVGFLLRRAQQRHLAIFARGIEGLTPTQFAALAKLAEAGPLSQNRLGRKTAMDAATIKGVTERLAERGLVASRPDGADRRLRIIALTEPGAALIERLIGAARRVSEETLAPLTAAEQVRLLALLAKLG